MLIGLIVVFALSYFIFFKFSSRKLSNQVISLLLFSWFLIFSCVLMLSFDISKVILMFIFQVYSKEYIQNFWYFSYWYFFILGTIILPILQEYYIAGDFTYSSKLIRAVSRNLIFYSVLLLISLVFILYLLVIESFTM